jgi:hypothetical protein
MGAIVAHGIRLTKNQETLEDGSNFVEIVPVEGGFDFPSYSSVKELVDYASSKGIDPSVWPIYYDVPPSDIDIEALERKCAILREEISYLSSEVISGNHWLERVADWLAAGERFCITE